MAGLRRFLAAAAWPAIGAGCACAFIAILNLHAQERDASYPKTRSWRAVGNILVVDMAGVCLYRVEETFGTNGFAAIAAVPKTALPPGTGCQ